MNPKLDKIPDPQNPDFGDIDALFADLQKYDDDHSQSTWLGRGLAAHIMGSLEEQREEQDQEDENEPSGLDTLRENIQSNMKLQDILDKHNKTLEQLGLELESPNKGGDFDEQETFAMGELTINILDKERFTLFLSSLSKETITESQRKLLEMVAKKLVRQVAHEYDIAQGDDRFLALFSSINNIAEQYKRLESSADTISELEHYMAYARQRSLLEYIDARKHSIFTPVGKGFNLSTYHTDASPEYYINAWNENFFTILDTIKKNQQAQSLYQEVLEYGKKSFAFAQEDLKRRLEAAMKDPAQGRMAEYFKKLEVAQKDIEQKLRSYES